MRGLKLTLFFGILILSLSFATAASTCLNISSKTILDYFNEIPSIDSQLSSCMVIVPNAIYSLVGDGNILVSITMNSGTIKEFYANINKKKTVTSITVGTPTKYTYKISLSETTIDKIMVSNDVMNEVLIAVKNKDIKIKAGSFFGSIKWFFAKFFLPKPTTPTSPVVGPIGKPNYCDETYLPGYREYANNKVLWDSYSSDTDKVCQSQYGKGVPSPCVHNVQLSISGNPYYLCWYNE